MQKMRSLRADVLTYFGANSSEVEELLAYNENVFHCSSLTHSLKFPLAPEPHITAWEEYAIASQKVVDVLVSSKSSNKT